MLNYIFAFKKSNSSTSISNPMFRTKSSLRNTTFQYKSRRVSTRLRQQLTNHSVSEFSCCLKRGSILTDDVWGMNSRPCFGERHHYRLLPTSRCCANHSLATPQFGRCIDIGTGGVQQVNNRQVLGCSRFPSVDHRAGNHRIHANGDDQHWPSQTQSYRRW